MSFLSPKNFIAPFQSGPHLIALVTLAFFVGVFRLAGGKITLHEDTSAIEEMNEIEERYQAPATIRRGGSRSLLQDQIDDPTEEPTDSPSNQPRSGKSPKDASSLDDIAKQLGLQ